MIAFAKTYALIWLIAEMASHFTWSVPAFQAAEILTGLGLGMVLPVLSDVWERLPADNE